ncbi:ribosome rescue GTPase HflX [Candidatus Pantoea carbekii]|uniref:GTPase HflX n=1 Tax=Candidatus Pantoea carbekii TaxID=1235990 RepID=U3U7K6_9GAMM|nr:ribosome rescue GTPase HflX [Candidatus Pantoea carbekii]AKC32522.1 GTP-binding protein hflX [Candidatus Pantoea carbekii]BAO00249.1 HflX protein [Candidatus Pantoea carbekii]
MFNHFNAGEQTILVHIWFSQSKTPEDLEEFKTLAASACLPSSLVITGRRKAPHPKYFVGEGKALEIADAVKMQKVSVVLFNHALTATQERNLERLCSCRIMDRTGLILYIFAQRARSNEGKLQVELAQLTYFMSRLVRGWTHLERQKGGIGLRGGPGETQIEIDRRLLRNRMDHILRRLERVEKQRTQSRQVRNKADVPTLSLVGYTNSGKSSLFNALTSDNVYTADQLFATLDPMLHRLDVANVGKVVIADTVGFIRDLPLELIVAFKATLKEISQSMLLLHIVDSVDPRLNDKIQQVNKILAEIKADKIPMLLIMNKIDLFKNCEARIDRDERNKPICVWLSARTGIGLPLLFQALSEHLVSEKTKYNLCLPPQLGYLRSYFYALQAIDTEWVKEDGSMILQIRIPVVEWLRLCKQEPLLNSYLI